MSDTLLGLLCFALTLLFYYASKWLYGKKRILPLMPLLLAPTLLVAVVMLFHIPYQDYMAESHWLLWLLGPATVAFAVPVYENRQLIRRHRWLDLSDMLQRSLAMRSITTPFAVEATRAIGGQTDLTALFVVLTGVIGMAVGESVLTLLAIRSRLGKGAGFGASAHGAGTAKAYQMGNEEGVVSSMVMMIAGMVTVLLAPLLGQLFW